MKKICILCEDSKIEEVRNKIDEVKNSLYPNNPIDKVRQDLKSFSIDFKHLSIPVSPTGELPATHWFCSTNVSDADYQNILDNQKWTIMEESTPSQFLEKHNLKIIL
jgi:hypothetical protein